MALTNAQLAQAIDLLVETIDEALKLVSDVLALHNQVLLASASPQVSREDRIRLQNLADAWKAAHQEEQS